MKRQSFLPPSSMIRVYETEKEKKKRLEAEQSTRNASNKRKVGSRSGDNSTQSKVSKKK